MGAPVNIVEKLGDEADQPVLEKPNFVEAAADIPVANDKWTAKQEWQIQSRKATNFVTTVETRVALLKILKIGKNRKVLLPTLEALQTDIQSFDTNLSSIQDNLLRSLLNHDIRGSLSSILLYTQICSRPDSDPKKLSDEMVFKKIDHLIDLIESNLPTVQDIVASAAYYVDQDLPLKRELVNLPKFLSIRQRSFEKNGGLNVRFELGEGFAGVDIHSGTLANLLINMSRNASFHGGATELLITVSKGENGEMILSVADDGKGIASEHIEKIFHLGFSTRIDTSKSMHGIGLANGCERADKAGFRIEGVEGSGGLDNKSKPGVKGAKFIFGFPKHEMMDVDSSTEDSDVLISLGEWDFVDQKTEEFVTRLSIKMKVLKMIIDDNDTSSVQEIVKDFQVKIREYGRVLGGIKHRFFYDLLSHDLRSSLNALSLYSEILLNASEEKLYSSFVKFSLAVDRALPLLSAAVASVAYYTGLPLTKTSVKIKDLLQANQPCFQSKADRVEVNVEVDEDVPNISVHEGTLINLLANMAKNAKEHGGATKMLIKVGKSPDGRVLIFVKDNGKGVDLPDRGKIFERGGSSKELGEKNSQPVGLGLADAVERGKAAGFDLRLDELCSDLPNSKTGDHTGAKFVLSFPA